MAAPKNTPKKPTAAELQQQVEALQAQLAEANATIAEQQEALSQQTQPQEGPQRYFTVEGQRYRIHATTFRLKGETQVRKTAALENDPDTLNHLLRIGSGVIEPIQE